MGQFRAKHLALLAATTLSLLMLSGLVWFDGDDPAAPQFSSEESEDRINVDDVDAMVDHDVAVVGVTILHVQVEQRHDSPLLVHGWRWCSRGPPLT